MVDTVKIVSLFLVIEMIIIRLFAENFILLLKVKMSPPIFSLVGIILNYFNNCFILNLNLKKFFKLKKNKISAGNPFLFLNLKNIKKFKKLNKNKNVEVLFDFDKPLIEEENFIIDHLAKHEKPKTDEEFGYYLAGLIESDGYFGDKSFEIAFHKDDISSAYYIKKYIGYGSVLFLKNKNSVRYVLRHKTGLIKVFSLVNGKFLSQYKIDQLIKHKYNEKYNVNILPKTLFDIRTNH
jgi:hypothetical protein